MTDEQKNGDTKPKATSWEEAFKIMQQAGRKLDKLDAKTKARALAWLVEKYLGEELGETVLAVALEKFDAP